MNYLPRTLSKRDVQRATALYGVSSMAPSPELARATGCAQAALRQILKKGEGAYYSSGSRPNQSAQGARPLGVGPHRRPQFSNRLFHFKKGVRP